MADSFFQELEKQENVKFEDLSNTRIAELEGQVLPSEYTISDFEADPSVQAAFDTVTDYLGENQTLGNALIDSGATLGEQDDVVEFLRDDVARLGAPIAKANILKDAPENVKEAYRLMQSRFDAAEVKGFGEQMQRIGDYGADIIFNPEMITTLGSIIGSSVTGGGTFAAQTAAKKTAQAAAKQRLKKAIAASGAAIKGNPKKFAMAMGTYYGGAGSYAQQSMDVSLDKREEIDPTSIAVSAGIGAPLGLAGYGLFAGVYFAIVG